ncbi:MAG: arginine--tRNA ligase [Cellvibrionales bacterium]|nr:arginine--tRNA ligase [Cellvibrionales bacterium]
MSVRQQLAPSIRQALAAAGLPTDTGTHLNPSGRPELGDYQINAALAAAKALKANPRELAARIVENLQLDEICAKVEIAGPGFINLRLNNHWLADHLAATARSPRLGLASATPPQTIVIDYSSPNVAKEMHVGHMRGTILGDVLARILEFQGHRVIRQNHIGDWGTQFGMLLAELSELAEQTDAAVALADLEQFYRRAKVRFDQDPAFAARARQNVVRLQSGDAECLALWRQFIDISMAHVQAVYQKLGVTLRPQDTRGESAYNADLPAVVADLQRQSLAVEDAGAQVVFLPELADKDGTPAAFIVQKADGGYLYATTDLAALRYRASTLKADRCLYFIDARQSLHMQQLFATARRAGWVDERVELTHCAYGTIMGKDGRPLKTRSGDTVKLIDLLDEAIQRAYRLVEQKSPHLSLEEKDEVAKAVGIGAIKYADLSKTRTQDYRFDWDAMLRFEGNTAPYLQYGYTRIMSLLRKADTDLDTALHFTPAIGEAERPLALALCQFPDAVEQVVAKAMPHELCNYLFALAGRFMAFYEACPILKDSVTLETRNARLQLAALTARTLNRGLEFLGIRTVERM